MTVLRSNNDAEPRFLMKTALDARPDELDGPSRTFVDGIRNYGWFATNVLGDGSAAAYSYTTGFWLTARVPELVLFGMAPEAAHQVFAGVYRSARAGNPLTPGASTDQVFENCPAWVFDVPERFHEPLFGWSRWFYGRQAFHSQHVVWPDPNGAFPWEPGFTPVYAGIQPDLTAQGWRHEVAR